MGMSNGKSVYNSANQLQHEGGLEQMFLQDVSVNLPSIFPLTQKHGSILCRTVDACAID